MKILEPITVGKVTLKNRIMFPPLTTGYEGRDGSITPQSLAFYERIAKGGAAYIVIGDVNPIPSFSPTPRLHSDEQIPSFAALAGAVHKHGAKLAVQIFHPEYDVEALAALMAQGKMDEVRAKMHHDMMHFTDEVTKEQLAVILDKMVACAVRAQKAGVDAIEIHGDRLIGALCSPKMNHRQDEYGGSFENRTRFALEFVKALRKAVPDMLIDYKLSIITPERGKGGINADDAVRFAQCLEAAGVDMLHVAQGNHTGNMADTIPPMGVQPYGFFVPYAAKVKKAVGIPVSAVGRIVDVSMAEHIVEDSLADIVALGRPLLADPDWGVKLANGRACDIRRCISCNKGCTDNIQNRAFLNCVLNAENGYEQTRQITPADVKKNVVVIGGGPAGMEAARVAALKGHTVTLFEKSAALGGQMNLAAVPPRKDELRRATQDLSHAVCSLPITLRLGEAATPEKVLALKPDAVIAAVGAYNFVPSIKGADGKNVRDAWSVLAGETSVFGEIVVIGGGLVGCETAEYLAAQGCKVTIVEMLDKIATGESVTVLPTLMEEFDAKGVTWHTDTTVTDITATAVNCKTKDGTQSFKCDFVVMAAGAHATAFDTAAYEAAGVQVVSVGDCAARPADIGNAIRTAYDAANAI